MCPSKPSTLPRWATNGGTQIVEPPSLVKDRGWNTTERPPAQFENWLLNLLYQWTQYLNAPDKIELGDDLDDTEVEAVTPRLTVEPVAIADYTCIGKFKDARLWIRGEGSTSAFAITVNADRATTGTDKWKKITTTQPAYILYLARDYFTIAGMAGAQDTDWGDGFSTSYSSTLAWQRLITLPADGRVEASALATNPRFTHEMSSESGVDRVLVHQWKSVASGHTRIYWVGSSSGLTAPAFEVTLNARWDNGTDLWDHDVTATSYRFIFSPQGLKVHFRRSQAPGNTWTDGIGATEWNTAPLNFVWQTSEASGSADHNEYGLENGFISFIRTRTTDGDDANPPSNNAQLNRLSAKNIPKAWVDFTTDSQTIHDGYNVSSVSFSGSLAVVNWHQDFDSVNYAVSVQTVNAGVGSAIMMHVTSKTVSAIQIAIFQATTGVPSNVTQINASANPVRLMVTAFGQQTS